MPLIDKTYFIGEELNIPDTNKTSVEERLNFLIAKYEDKFLNEVFGYDLYKQYKAGITADQQVWKDLRDGVEYTVGGRTFYWRGLRNSTTKESLIANYVYYWWMRNQVSVSTVSGEKVNKSENSTNTSPNNKMTKAWNEMVEQIWQLVDFLDNNVSIYTGWSWYNGINTTSYWMGYNHARLKDMFYPINSFNL